MLGPTGIGVLYGKAQILEDMPPYMFGGDMILEVSYEDAIWNDLPYKFEAVIRSKSTVDRVGIFHNGESRESYSRL